MATKSLFKRASALVILAMCLATTTLSPVVQAADAEATTTETAAPTQTTTSSVKDQVQLISPLPTSPVTLPTAQTSPTLDPEKNITPTITPKDPTAENALSIENGITPVAPIETPKVPTDPQAPEGNTPAVAPAVAPQDELSKETKKGNSVDLKVNNGSGSAAYAFPIAVPPGRNGVQPPLAVTYNSANRDRMNLFGMGWSLDLASITRSTRTGVDHLYTTNDFTLNLFGSQQTLKPIALVDGTHGTYGVEIESEYLIVEFLQDDSWRVTNKSGTVFTFGKTAESRQDKPQQPTRIYQWMISDMRDANNNFVKFLYTKDSGQIIPQRIQYTGSGDVDGPFKVEFITEQRPDVNSSESTQFTVTNRFRIREIQTKVDDVIRSRYVFAYTAGGNTATSLLQSITVTGINSQGASLSLPPTRFTYNQRPRTWTENQQWRLPAPIKFSNWGDVGTRIADINGDGLPDVVQSNGPGVSSVYINNGNGWTPDAGWQLPTPIIRDGNDQGFRFADLNGDGLADIISHPSPFGPASIYLNTGSGWQLNPQWSFPAAIVDATARGTGLQIEDVNVDGLVDVIERASPCCPFQASRVHINNGDGTWTQDPNWQFPYSEFYQQNSGVDLGVRLADINGDGLVDAVQARDQRLDGHGNVINQVYLNTGYGWRSDESRTLPEFFTDIYNNDLGVRFVDVNGDGLADLARNYSVAGAEQINRVYLNTGTSWALAQDWQLPAMPFSHGQPSQDPAVQILDINGDGATDFLEFNMGEYNDGIRPVEPYTTYLATTGNRAQQDDVLTQITQPEGGTTAITYAPSTSFRSANGAQLNKVPYVLQTVSRIEKNDNRGGVWADSYSYAGGSFYVHPSDPHKNRFAGFARVTATAATGDSVVTNFYIADSANPADHYSLMGMVYAQDFKAPNGSSLKSLRTNYIHNDIGNGRYFVATNSQATVAFDPTGPARAQATSYTYDADGNMLTQVDYGEVTFDLNAGTFVDIGNDKKTQTITYAVHATRKIRNAVASVVTTNQGNNRIAHQRYYYDANALNVVGNGNMTRGETWLNPGNIFIGENSTYDNFGNKLTQTDALGNVSTIVYDARNLYPASVTNSLNQTTTVQYDAANGALISARDANGLEKSNAYDGLGRVVRVTVNNNVVEDYNYGDAVFPTFVRKLSHPARQVSTEIVEYFDGFGRSIQTRNRMRNALYSVTRVAYDSKGRVAQKFIPVTEGGLAYVAANGANAAAYTFAYDGLDRATQIAGPVETTNFEFHGWDTRVVDGNGHAKLNKSDAYGRLIAVVQTLNRVNVTTSYTYNILGHLTRITEANGNLRYFTSDTLGRRLTAEDFHRANDNTFTSWQYAYDANGNMLTQTASDGTTTTWVYDALNRVVSENLSTTPEVDTVYVYDAGANSIGRLSNVTRISGAITTVTAQEYDVVGNVTRQTRTIDGQNYVSLTSYDWLNRVVNTTAPNGVVVSYTYNYSGQIQTIDRQEAPNGAVIPVVTAKTYTAAGQVESIQMANGTRSQYSYFDDVHVRNKTTNNPQGVIQNITYAYDAAGNITTVTEAAATSIRRTSTYRYDDLDRLIEARSTNMPNTPDSVVTYTYDSVGNILTASDTGTYAYAFTGNANPHAVTSITAANNAVTTFTYDARGNMTNDQTRVMQWSGKDELMTVQKGAITTTFAYDHAGNRVLKSAGNNRTVYVSGGYEFEDKNGARIVRNYIYDGSNLVATIEETPAAAQAPAPVALLVENFDVNRWINITGVWNRTANNTWAQTVGNIKARSTKDVMQQVPAGTTLKYSFQLAVNGSAIAQAAPVAGSPANGAGMIFMPSNLDKYGGNSYMLIQTRDAVKVYKGTATGIPTNPNTVTEVASYASPAAVIAAGSPVPFVTYEVRYTPSTGAMQVYKAGALLGTYTDPAPLTFSQSILATTLNATAEFDTVRVESQAPQVAGVGTIKSTNYSHTDHLGSGSLVTDSTGSLIEQLNYQPFGKDNVSVHTPAANGTMFATKKKFTGKEVDDDTGLYYYGARYYNPAIARFISLDPVSRDLSQQALFTNPQRFNTYSYALNNPVKYTDPDGRFAFLATFAGPAIAEALVAVAEATMAAYMAQHIVADVQKSIAVVPAQSPVIIDIPPPLPREINIDITPIEVSAPQDYGTTFPAEPQKPITFITPVAPPQVRRSGQGCDAQGTMCSSQARPEGVPLDWLVKPTRKNDGIIYQNPTNEHESVRLMDAKLDSQWPSQQVPYAKQMKSGKALDVDGNRVDPASEEAHIPQDQFKFRQ